MPLKALFLNCTLKKSPQESNTEAFIQHAEPLFHSMDVKSEIVRVVDHNVAFGNTSDEGSSDGWPSILEKIKACDIFVIATPIWRGDRSSVAKQVAERMDGMMSEQNEQNGQYPSYNKVAGVMVDGNEDGAKKAISSICFDLSGHGFTVPVNAFTYYVGKAGPGPSFIEAGGARHYFTNNMLYMMVHNLVHMARILKQNPYPTDLKRLAEEAKKISN